MDTFWQFWGLPVKTVCQTGLPVDASQRAGRGLWISVWATGGQLKMPKMPQMCLKFPKMSIKCPKCRQAVSKNANRAQKVLEKGSKLAKTCSKGPKRPQNGLKIGSTWGSKWPQNRVNMGSKWPFPYLHAILSGVNFNFDLFRF